MLGNYNNYSDKEKLYTRQGFLFIPDQLVYYILSLIQLYNFFFRTRILY